MTEIWILVQQREGAIEDPTFGLAAEARRLIDDLGGTGRVAAVALGAFGAHGLKKSLADLPDAAQRLEWWDTAARYHLMHALALGLAAYLVGKVDWSGTAWTGWAFQMGILLFCGSLYVMPLTGWKMLGAVTPLGGLGLLMGWLLLILGALKWPAT